jgi:hypothetical protein
MEKLERRLFTVEMIDCGERLPSWGAYYDGQLVEVFATAVEADLFVNTTCEDLED